LNTSEHRKKYQKVGNLNRLEHLKFGQSDKINISFSNLTYRVPETSHCAHRGFKTILKNVSGEFRSGQLHAVMGPSGAGKTSLLNVLAGYITHGINGKVLINNKKLKTPREYQQISAYIMQDDRLQIHLTVYESLYIASSLKCKPSKDQNERIENILLHLGLSEARNTKAIQLSGGQRKRLAIAQELINNPPLMFFDEPTSGLDSQTSYQVVTLMKSLADAGRTIICTIHQPSARLFEIFDHLYVMQGGQAIYDGQVSNLITFLTANDLVCPKYHNPADFVMEVASGEFGYECISQLIIATQESQNFKLKDRVYHRDQIESPTLYSGYNAPFWKQFWILFKRQLRITFRNPMLSHLRFVAHVGVGLLFGGLCWQIGNDSSKIDQNVSFIFLSMLFLLFSSLMPTLMQFPADINVMIAEYRNRWYSSGAYFLAKTLSDLPFSILFDMLFTVIAYFMSGQPIASDRFFLFNTILVLTNLVVQSMGLLIGAASPSLEASTFIGPICAIPVLIFAGFFIKKDDMMKGWQWLTYTSFFRYAFESALVALYGDIGDGPRVLDECSRFNETLTTPNPSNPFPIPETIQCPEANIILSEENGFNIDEENLWSHCLILCIFFLVLRIFAFLALLVQIFFHAQSAVLRIQYAMYKEEFVDDTSSNGSLSNLQNNKSGHINNDLRSSGELTPV